MIASLRGVLAAKGKDSVVVQAGGVGFRIFVPQSLLEQNPGIGQDLTLYTHLHVRENELTLYGCASEEELSLFGTLLGVSGVGPKVALAVLSALPPDRLRAAIAQEDLAVLSRVPGIGPKTAKKLVFDLKDKIAAQMPPGEPVPAFTQADADLVAALTTLGYSVAEAQEAIRSLPREELPLEERVRLALAYFVR
ncbi:MAG: Holliday junction branch migration protein RuvA [Anaerolineae bacterium]|nr:Holliday junction branch migration protein RuvA [Anaerolineae bacterium]